MLAEDSVVDLLDLAQPVGRAAEDARVATAHECHAPALAALEARQRADERRAPDRDPAAHWPRQLDRLEKLGGLAREDRDPLGALGRQVALEELGGALERGVQPHLVLVGQVVVLSNAPLGLVEQRAYGR